MKNQTIYYLLFISLFLFTCQAKSDKVLLTRKKVEQVLVEADGHVMVYGSIPNFNKMDSMTYDSIWGALAKKSANLEYIARKAYVLTEDCMKFPKDFQENTSDFNRAILDSLYHNAIKKEMKFMRDSTNFETITFLEILKYNERLSRLTMEMNELCNH